MKHATIIRLGAIGDAVWTLPIIRELYHDGYKINVHCKKVATPVYKNNPFVDKLYTYPNKLGTKVDILVPVGSKVIDLENTIEGKILSNKPIYGCVEHPERYTFGCMLCASAKQRRKSTINYVEEQLRLAGLEDRNPSTLGTITIPDEDIEAVRTITADWKDKFVILWSLATTAHKQYSGWFKLMQEFCQQHPNVLVYTMGAPECKVYEREAPQIRAGHWPLDKSITLISLANLIIGGETGPMNIASCFNIKKILFLSHSSKDNLAKHWTNTVTVQPHSECHPCYQLHNTLSSCPTKNNTPVCTLDIGYGHLLYLLNRSLQ